MKLHNNNNNNNISHKNKETNSQNYLTNFKNCSSESWDPIHIANYTSWSCQKCQACPQAIFSSGTYTLGSVLKRTKPFDGTRVLWRYGATEWAAPTFIIPKKDEWVCWVSDFCELNKLIKQKIDPLPHIMDILCKRKGYNFFTKMDISMQYYTFELDDESKDLCVIVTSFGKYKYNRLPMGIKQSPYFAQEIIEDTLRDIQECDVYIYDSGAFHDTWEEHLTTLENNGTSPKQQFHYQSIETWMGSPRNRLAWILTHTNRGLKPWKKKIEAIQHPQNIKEVCSFIGAVTL
jgi:hypothetical protein